MKKRIIELSIILLGVWMAMILILVILELVVVGFESPSREYWMIIIVQIVKLATAGLLVGGWLLGWYRITIKYFWRRVDDYENMARHFDA